MILLKNIVYLLHLHSEDEMRLFIHELAYILTFKVI